MRTAIAILMLGLISIQAKTNYIVGGNLNSDYDTPASDWNSAWQNIPSSDHWSSGDTFFVAAWNGSYGRLEILQPCTIYKATTNSHGTGTGWKPEYGSNPATFAGGINIEASNVTIDGQDGGGPGSWTTNYGFRITRSDPYDRIIKVNFQKTLSSLINDVTIKHAEIVGTGNLYANILPGYFYQHGVEAWATTNLTISHCLVHNTAGSLFRIGVWNQIIEHCYLGSFYSWEPGTHGCLAICASLYANPRPTIFRNNMIVVDKSSEQWLQGSSGFIMFDSHFNRQSDGSIANNLQVYGNVFYDRSNHWRAGNAIIGGWFGNYWSDYTSDSQYKDGYEEFIGANVYNNTFVNLGAEAGGVLGHIVYRYGNNFAYNNLFWCCEKLEFTLFSGQTYAANGVGPGNHNYNWFVGTGTDAWGEVNGAYSSDTNIFMDMGNLDFRLKAASPAGLVLGGPVTNDVLSVLRGGDNKWDIGAFEFTDVPPLTNVFLDPSAYSLSETNIAVDIIVTRQGTVNAGSVEIQTKDGTAVDH